MESKWPFMLIAFGLVFLLGLTISSLERTNVMKHWDKRRCDFAVMAAAGFFKEDHDPRSRLEFASENFNFCMKSMVDKFITVLMAPIGAMFEKQVNLTNSSLDTLNTIRSIANTLYNTLSSYLEQFYRRFNTSIFEISRIVQYFQMAMGRANAMVMSMLYSGITMFRGMINAIQFAMKVILIICGIMIAAIIVLWFVLFPVIPLIISTLGAIVFTVSMMATIISSQVADQANRSRGPFCFVPESLIPVIDEHSKQKLVKAKDIKIGDVLSNGSTITAIIVMDGMNVPLFEVEGIRVSGSHLIKGTDGQWKSVSDDERAKPLLETSDILYCFNTTNHVIPVCTPHSLFSKHPSFLLFRDWEEFAEADVKGHYAWNFIVLKHLNNHSSYSKWKDSLGISTEVPLVSENMKVKTAHGYVEISKLVIGYDKLLDKHGNTQTILGRVDGEVENAVKTGKSWHTELFEWSHGVWKKGQSTVGKGVDKIIGQNIITDTGEFIIWDDTNKIDKVIRDFTDIGHKTIHETYPLVASRLRIYE
jgi:hypothetical protein